MRVVWFETLGGIARVASPPAISSKATCLQETWTREADDGSSGQEPGSAHTVSCGTRLIRRWSTKKIGWRCEGLFVRKSRFQQSRQEINAGGKNPSRMFLLFHFLIAFRSIGAVGNQKGRNSYDQDFCVERHRPVARIKTVARDTLVIRR